MLNKKLKNSQLILVTVACLILDQLTKYLFLNANIGSINQDLAFSLKFLDPLLVNAFSLAVFLLAIYVFMRDSIRSLGVSLILSGGLSNIIDRIFRGGVVDFIDLKIWPSFNLADSMISVGVILMIFSLLRENSRT